MQRSLIAFALGAAYFIWPPAEAQPLKMVTITVGTSVLTVAYPMITLPLSLGYWKGEGYDVEVQPFGASLQAVQQMVSGNSAALCSGRTATRST